MDVLLREAQFRFPGGLELPAMKEESTSRPIGRPLLPSQLILPIKQHIGSAAEPLVKPGERVLKGQLIASKDGDLSANLHAPTSGTVVSIGIHPVAHPSQQATECIRLIPDGKDEWIARPVTKRDWQSTSRKDTLTIIEAAGIVGLGGAVFPTDKKLESETAHSLKALIINAAECEPYISCDDMLMREAPYEILQGVQILMRLTESSRCLLGIEDNKPEAIRTMRAALAELGDYRIELYSLKSIYPQGGEKQLIQSLTGEEVPRGKLPIDLGYLMFNVATAKAVYDAVVEDSPLIKRVVTVTGHGIQHPQNVEALLGTPVSELIEYCGGYKQEHTSTKLIDGSSQLIMGGPLMGISLATDAVPVVKAMNCLLLADSSNNVAPKTAKPCIRCGECAQACPASLLPQQLYWYTKAEDYAEVDRFHIFDCIECGACDFVCPSHIPLVNYFRHAKGEIRQRHKTKRASDIARERFERREQRLEKIAAVRKARLEEKKKRIETNKQTANSGSLENKKEAINEIMQRVKAKNKGKEE